MVCFQTKNTKFGINWRALEWKMLLYFMTFWNILRPFGIINLSPFGIGSVVIRYIVLRLATLAETSGWSGHAVQGDQLSLLTIAKSVAQPIFC
jgi:hypothetical protein